MRIALGPFLACIDRELTDPRVFHLASRLLDGIRTTGITVPRQVELYNSGEEPVATDGLAARLRLYPPDAPVARLAGRILVPGRARQVLAAGVDFADLTDIFTPEACRILFDEVTTEPEQGGVYGRIFMPGKMIAIPWEQEEGAWLKEFQWRLVYEYSRGNIPEGVLTGEEIPKRLRPFLDDLKYVGGEQTLSKVFVSDALPPVDTLRVLKRNGIGVVAARGMGCLGGSGCRQPNFRMDQTLYEELVRLEAEGMRFYLLLELDGQSQVREFFRGLWVTREGKRHLPEVHTTMAMFGSSCDVLRPVLDGPIREFFPEAARQSAPGRRLCRGPWFGPRGHAHGGRHGGGARHLPHRGRHRRRRDRPDPQFRPTGHCPVHQPGHEHPAGHPGQAVAVQDLQPGRIRHQLRGEHGADLHENRPLPARAVHFRGRRSGSGPMAAGSGNRPWASSAPWSATCPPAATMWGPSVRPGSWPAVTRLAATRRAGRSSRPVIDDPGRYWRERGIPLDKVRLARENLTTAGVPIPGYIDEALAAGAGA